jgi:dTDP-4-amino-4,6-dideoxygalactose transaminase
MVGERLWRTYGKRVGFLDQSPVVLGRIYRTDLATTIRRLGNVESSIEKQRANADYYARALRVPPEVICREMPGAYYNRFQFPLTFPDSEQRDYLSAYLHRRLIDTARPLNDIVEAARRYYNYAGDCPVAERLSKRTLIIPSNHSLAPNDIRRIADCVSRGWNELSRGAFPHRVFGSVL